MNKKQLGLQGEQIASRYIEELGYKVLENNYRTKKGEIDIIAFHKETIVFTEVKTRTNLKYGYPVEAVTPKKATTIKNVALEYISKGNLDYKVRFDVVEIFFSNEKNYKVKLIENAFC